MRAGWLLLAAILAGCGPLARPGGTAPVAKPYVVLVSLDGFRFDYAQQYQAKNILDMAAHGVAAEAMIPCFPSRTFPSHYTIVTGMDPAHHNLVANDFYDPKRNARYNLKDRAAVQDGSWYGGTPLWVLAEQQGMRAASYFWVGSEAAVADVRPSYYYNFDKTVSYDERISEVGRWLRLPEAERPQLVLMYFSLVDSVGHFYGPGSDELTDAIARLDDTVGKLRRELDSTGLPINLILVSDHGMVRVDNKNPIVPADFVDLAGFEVAHDGPLQMYYSTDRQLVSETYATLKQHEGPYRVYLREQMPDYLRFRDNRRIGDIVMIAEPPHILAPDHNKKINPATHGFDPYTIQDMHGIFYASGPAFRQGLVVERFESIHVYPLVARILGLTIGDIDGRIDVLEGVLR